MIKPWRPDRQRGVHASHRHGLAAHLREFIWPTIGLVAFGRWIFLKLLRQAHRPHFVALGLAIGVLVAFFPILGTHVILVVVLTTIFRASFISALLGTMLANPWTVGPMWALSFHLGRRMLGMTPGNEHAVEHLNRISWVGLWDRLYVLLDHVILPTVLGGLVIGGPVAVLIYVIVYWWLRKRRGKAAK